MPGFRYVVYGSNRGYFSTHRTKAVALRALAEDARARMRAGDPSDAEAYRWRDGGWELIGPEVNVELVDPSELRPTGPAGERWANARLVFADNGRVLFAAGHTRVEAGDPAVGKLIRVMEEVPEAKKPARQIDEFAPRLYWQFYGRAASPDGKVVAAMIA